MSNNNKRRSVNELGVINETSYSIVCERERTNPVVRTGDFSNYMRSNGYNTWVCVTIQRSSYAYSRNIRNLCLKIRKLHVNGIRAAVCTRARIIQGVSVQDFRPWLWHGRKPLGAMKIVAEYEIRESEVEVVEEEKQPWH